MWDSAIHWLNHYPVDKYYQTETNCIIHWLEIYPVDSIFYLSNNCALVFHMLYYYMRNFCNFIGLEP